MARKKGRPAPLSMSMVEQVDTFIRMCKYAKVSGANGGFGITKEMLLDKGVKEKTFEWLVANHYCNKPHKGKPLWIANENPYYPSQTISNLESIVSQFKAQQAQGGGGQGGGQAQP